MPNRNKKNSCNNNNNSKHPLSLISGLGIDLEDNKQASRTNYTENLLLQNNNRNRMNLSPPSQQQHKRGQIYSKKSSMDDLLTFKHLSVSPPKYTSTTLPSAIDSSTTTTRRVPISRISLKYLRPSLASSTNSLSSVNHSIASSTSSLSDHNNQNHNSSKSCLKIDSNYA